MTVILDGGMGGELVRRGYAPRGGLWSAQTLVDAPQEIFALHREYVDAGARVITTNTYSTVPSYLDKAGVGHRMIELVQLAAHLAAQCAEGSECDVRVAGSLPPLAESYRPDLVPTDASSLPIYRALAEALEPSVDIFLCETMSSAREARNAAQQARAVSEQGGNQPVWVSWTLDDRPGGGLRSGDSLKDALDRLEDLEIDAYLVNCSRPESIAAALEELGQLTTKPVGCYANRAETVPEGWTLDNEITIAYRDDLGAAVFADWGLRSVNAGASIVGGCCGIGPEHIRALVETLGDRSDQ